MESFSHIESTTGSTFKPQVHAPKLVLTRALRDTLELQSNAGIFFSGLARQASCHETRKLLFTFARVEQLLALELDSMATRLTDARLPECANLRTARIKTAPEWSNISTITTEQAIAVSLDCTRRAFHHHMNLAATFDGPASDFFLTLAQADEDRASLLEKALDRRLAELQLTHRVDRVIAETLDAVRRAGKSYTRIANRTSRARTKEFLLGMVEVCSLHAANIQKLLSHPVNLQQGEPVFEGLIEATSPAPDCSIEQLDFESAMRMAMHAHKRAALLHGMQARAFPGEEAHQLLEIADAERRHAATIASVLDRLMPDDEEVGFEASPFADAPRESWTCPAPSSRPPNQEDLQPPSLRLVG